MRVFNKQIATNVLMNTNLTSAAVPLKSIYTYCITALVSGVPNGLILLQASNDPETNDTQPLGSGAGNPAPANWVNISNSTFALTASGESMWNVNAVGYNYVRVAYTDSSGGTSTATVSIVFNGKGM
jgi:hypothetical protein